MNLDDILKALIDFQDKPALAKALKEKPELKPVIYQAFFNEGHGVATAAAATEKATLEGTITTLRGQITKAETDLADWKKANPGEAAIRTEYEGKLAALQAEQTRVLADRDAADAVRNRDTVVKEIKAELKRRGVDPDIAEAKVNNDATLKRIKADKDGVKLYQPENGIPYPETDPAKAVEAMVDQLFATVKPEHITSTVKRGPGRSTTTGADGKPAEGSELAEDIRASVRKKFGHEPVEGGGTARARRPDPLDKLNDRMGMRNARR